MNKGIAKKAISLFTIGLLAAGITGCGQTHKTVKEHKENVAKAKSSTHKVTTEDTKFSKLISYMEKQTQGRAKTLYDNQQTQVHKLGDLTVSLDKYELVQLNDFSDDFSIPFGDQTDGGVILAHYTVKNNSNKDLYYMPVLDITFTGAEKDYDDNTNLIPEDVQLANKLTPKNNYTVKAGQSVSGYLAYPFGKDDLTKMLSLSTVSIEVPPAEAKKGDFSSPIGQDGKFNISLNDKGAEKISSNAGFYQDKVTADNMGEKKMLKEKHDINKSQKLGNINVTLEGYQFAEFKPNSVEAPRFSSFKNGIVLLTVKFKLDNKESDQIGLSSTDSTLFLNDRSQYTLNEGMLNTYKNGEIMKPNESGELFQVYPLDEEEYSKIWKNKTFEIEFGPITNADAREIVKGRKANFTLPN